MTVLQVQDAHGRPEQFVLADLEKLITGIAVENMGQRLAVVAAGREARTLQGPLDLLTQERNVAGVARIGGRGKEADEQALAGDLALLVEAFDGDGVHVHRTVHRGTPIGLVDPQ